MLKAGWIRRESIGKLLHNMHFHLEFCIPIRNTTRSRTLISKQSAWQLATWQVYITQIRITIKSISPS